MIDRKRLDTLLEAALELEPHERPEFLARACETAELRDAIERLLDASEEETTARPVGAALWQELADAGRGDLTPGTRLGPFRIVRELGRGGMAVVYLAERADQQYEQTVALKILERPAPGASTSMSQAVARFERERRILASLEHPGIAHILDGGIAPDGRPWFALEHVEGLHIDRYCDQQQLTLRGRLQLFVEVGKAVAAAHRQLVVHRDIKPSNILISRDGQPKLLDFGIAKLVEEERSTSSRPDLTRAAVPMTPRYASPEQASGKPVTTASDVYQLGLLLYELLVGSWAFEFGGSTPSELAGPTSSREPTRPSAAVIEATASARDGAERARRRGCGSTKQLRKLLVGDLDTIVLTALRPQAERRYESASRLVEDVERFLTNRPILARPDSLAYRVGKFVRRNRWAVAASAAGLAAVVSLSLVYTLSVRAERDRAEKEAEKARQVAEFLGDLFRAADPYAVQQKSPRTALELVDEGARQITEGSALAAQPEVKAALLDLLGDIYGRLGRMETAVGHNARALSLRGELLGPLHPDTLESRLHRVQLERLSGRHAEALAMARELAPLLEAGVGSRHRLVSRVQHELALGIANTGSAEEARALIESAIHIEEVQKNVDSSRLASLFTGRAAILARLGDLEAAVAEANKAVTLRREIDPGNPALAIALADLAGHLRGLGKIAPARAALVEAERILLARAGPEHPQTLRNSFALADLAVYLGEPAEALARLDRDLPTAERVLGPKSYWLGHGRMERATALVDLGRLAEAVPEARRGRDQIARALGEEALLTLDTERRVANILKDAGELREARDLLLPLVARAEAKAPPKTLLLPMTLKELAEVELKLGAHEEAEAAILRSLALQAELWPEGHIDTVRSLALYAEILGARGNKLEARAKLEEAMALAGRVEGMNSLLRQRLDELRTRLTP